MFTWEDIPPKEQEALRQAFCNEPGIRAMESTANSLQKQRKYIEALNLKKEIAIEWEYVKKVHLEKYKKEHKNTVNQVVKLSEIGLPEDKMQELIENMVSLFMACDIIETCHFNANEVLRDFNKDYSMDNFNDIKLLAEGVKDHLTFLQKETGYMDDLLWGEGCDKQYEMIKNKARAIIKKKNDMNRWGQNLKKYIDGTLDKPEKTQPEM